LGHRVEGFGIWGLRSRVEGVGVRGVLDGHEVPPRPVL